MSWKSLCLGGILQLLSSGVKSTHLPAQDLSRFCPLHILFETFNDRSEASCNVSGISTTDVAVILHSVHIRQKSIVGKRTWGWRANRPVRESNHIHLQSPHTHAHTLTQTLKWTVKGHWKLLTRTIPYKKGLNKVHKAPINYTINNQTSYL